MKLFGLTGGIGTGKSTAAELLVLRKIPVIDTDVVAREIVGPGEPALAEIVTAFGPQVLDDAGKLRRAILAEIVFADESKRHRLEAILHPRIRERWLAQVSAWRNQRAGAAVVVIPLLFETGAQANFDAVICTGCSHATQRQRLETRGWSESQINQRLAAQWPIEKKIAASKYVIWTEGSLEIHERQLDLILGRL